MIELLGLTPEQLAAGIYGLILAGLAAAQYFSSRSKSTVHPDPVITGIGARLGDGYHNEQIVEQLRRIANALEGRRIDDLDKRIAILTQQLEQALSRPLAKK